MGMVAEEVKGRVGEAGTMYEIAEWVAPGHPDKVADYISDSVVDMCLADDKMSRVAVETLISSDVICVAGEVTSRADCSVGSIKRLVERCIEDRGYSADVWRGKINIHLTEQSGDISLGVNSGGAGDQGVVYGYATDETPEMLPTAQVLAMALMSRREYLRSKGKSSLFKPDAKCLVVMRDGVCDTVVFSTQHTEKCGIQEIYHTVEHDIVLPVVTPNRLLVNPTGRFVKGGPAADTGVTGRKIIVDTYCGMGRHGGGAFSGKDPTKVDRSAAYMARFVAKRLVQEVDVIHRATIGVAYSIGVADPMAVWVESDHPGIDDKLSKAIRERYDFRPASIIDRFGLRELSYKESAILGAFRPGYPWEEI
jgi:S-adenosylmethionine synthetase